MLITLKQNKFTPISLTDLYRFKKQYKPTFTIFNKIVKNIFKSTAFYSFWLIASTEVDN